MPLHLLIIIIGTRTRLCDMSTLTCMSNIQFNVVNVISGFSIIQIIQSLGCFSLKLRYVALLYINFQFLLEIRYLCHRYSKSVPPFQVTVKLHYTVISVYSASNHSMNGGIFKHYISLKYNQIMQILIFHIPIISLGRLCGMNHSEKPIMAIISYTRYMRPADLPCPW